MVTIVVIYWLSLYAFKFDGLILEMQVVAILLLLLLLHSSSSSWWRILAEHCRTDDLVASVPISCLPPYCIDPKVLRLNILIYCSQPGAALGTVKVGFVQNGSLLKG